MMSGLLQDFGRYLYGSLPHSFQLWKYSPGICKGRLKDGPPRVEVSFILCAREIESNYVGEVVR
jgi:hypothetical protein